MTHPKSSPHAARMRTVALVALVCVASAGLLLALATRREATPVPGDQDWPWWRGPDGTAVARGGAPSEWSADSNVIWKTDLPGQGHGTPIIHSQRIFLASADEQAKVLTLYCFDAVSGNELWQAELQRGGLMHKSIKNSYASASAACDGRYVFYPWVADNSLWIAAVDMDGELAWRQQVAPFTSEHGYASSPCFYRSSVIVPSDNLGQSYLTALDRTTGDLLWQTQRSAGGSYGSPVVANLAGRDQLLLSGQNSVISYNPSNGEIWWRCEGPGPSTIGTMTWHENLAIATCGAPPMIAGVMAIEADSGRVAWQADAMANVPSSLVVEDRLLVTEDRGTIACFSIDTGELLWRERLGGNFSASPVLAGGLVYLPNEAGQMFVFRVGVEFELVAENELTDGGFASPVIVNGRIYVRTNQHLYCIGDASDG